jgi:glycosyltransferase involved in cell wall biosynthesis
MHIALLVPAPFDTISGGYIYDRRIVAGLRAAGHAVTVVELTGQYPLPDETAIAAAKAAWAALPDDATIVIDGLALPAFEGLTDELSARDVVGLIHHPTGLETGLQPATSVTLLATERAMFPRLARAIVTSPFTGAALTADFAVNPARVAVVVPGTEDAPRSTCSTDGVCRILSIGTLIPRKGHDILLRALARLFDLDWHLTIAGSPDRDPVHAHTLMALAEELDIARRVTFLGELDGEPLAALWREADLFALATHFEGYGMVIAEALKRGLPVAVTKGGAAGDLVTPEAGTVSPPGDVDQLSKALRRLVFDTALRADFAEAAWQIGQTLPDWTAQARAFAQALEGTTAA